ncbi:hypothetical protein [Paenibacillus validus]|uniref:hypothetical protein n=1 Tax=Paenibacillus validus TaxID=44253 RepID=UPI003D2B0290
MHDSLKIRVSYIKFSFLDQVGGETSTHLGIFVQNSQCEETIYIDKWTDLTQVTPTDAARQLKKLSNINLLSWFKQAEGFYLYDQWYTVRPSVNSQQSTSYISPNDVWEGKCRHCGFINRVKYYNDKPHCTQCIMVLENKKKGRLEPDK